jgi:UDP-N-acetylmuramoylalanine--D-glutamate ligase
MKGLQIQKNKIAIIGFGISGISVARYFLKQGIQVDVYEDKKQIDFNQEILKEFDQNTLFKIYFSDSLHTCIATEYDYVIASPGGPQTHPIVQSAQNANIEYVTDINIFLRIFKNAYSQGTVISVTGSNGKSTTVSLMYDVLKAAGKDAYLGGNIGTSPLDFFEQIKTDQPIIVLETSSYQLEYMKESDYFDIACILNLSDNHLNRYGGKKELYAQAKLGGIHPEYTDVILNLDDEYTRKYILPHIQTKHVLGVQFIQLEGSNIITFEDDALIYTKDGEQEIYIPKVSQMKLKGIHNIYNGAFVCGVLHILEISTSSDIQTAFCNFGGLIHRVQLVDSINGVHYINDSKSTSPDATVKALDTIGDTKNVILISGGNDKDISYDSMHETWSLFVKNLILLPGTANTKLKELAKSSGVELIGEVQTMQEAFDIASSHAGEGDTVLLSPATDSHASFKSFEDRGNQFIQCIQNLKNS